jgi:hypothetical protein
LIKRKKYIYKIIIASSIWHSDKLNPRRPNNEIYHNYLSIKYVFLQLITCILFQILQQWLANILTDLQNTVYADFYGEQAALPYIRWVAVGQLFSWFSVVFPDDVPSYSYCTFSPCGFRVPEPERICVLANIFICIFEFRVYPA